MKIFDKFIVICKGRCDWLVKFTLEVLIGWKNVSTHVFTCVDTIILPRVKYDFCEWPKFPYNTLVYLMNYNILSVWIS